jgi:hypothetical protein
MPNTMVPADLMNEARRRWKIDVMTVSSQAIALLPRRRRQRRIDTQTMPARSPSKKCIFTHNLGMRHCRQRGR